MTMTFVDPSAFLAPATPAFRADPSRAGLAQQTPAPAAAVSAIGVSSVAALAAAGAAAAVLAGRRRTTQASAGRATTSAVVVQAGPKILEGTGGPFPDDFWDPAGLAKGKSDEQLLHWRAVELKHGRVCMLACLGWFHVAAGWHPIGDAAARMRVSDDPLVNVTQLPIGGAFQVVFTIMVLEWLTTYVIKPPADKPWDILGWKSVVYEEEPDWKDVQLQELNNGRLAMMGIIGLIAQDVYTGDYFAGIAKPCFGNIACADIDSWTGPFPTTPGAQPVIIP